MMYDRYEYHDWEALPFWSAYRRKRAPQRGVSIVGGLIVSLLLYGAIFLMFI